MKNTIYSIASRLKRILLKEVEPSEERAESDLLDADSQHILNELRRPNVLREKLKQAEMFSSEEAYRNFMAYTKNSRLGFLNVKLLSVAALFLFFLSIGIYKLSRPVMEGKDPTYVVPGKSIAQLTINSHKTVELKERAMTVAGDDGVRIDYKDGKLVYTVSESGKPEEVVDMAIDHVLKVPYGGESKVVLTDGTEIHLNAGSRLVYPERFVGRDRVVMLEGEAFFVVAPDKEHPFVVKTRFGDVKVLGTTFNVNAYKDNPQCYATLVSGRVLVESNARSLELMPGEQATMSLTSCEKRKVDVNDFIGWAKGCYAFKDVELDLIMKNLSKWYNFKVQYSSDALKMRRYTGRLRRSQSIRDILEAMEMTGNLRYAIHGKTLYLYEK